MERTDERPAPPARHTRLGNLVVAVLGFACAASGANKDAAVNGAGNDGDLETTVDPSAFRVLLFTRTTGFRHDSIAAATAAFLDLQGPGGYVADHTEDPGRFSADGLAPYQVVVFLLTTGDVLNDVQQAAFEVWVRAGGGTVGVHSASDTEYDWSFYGGLMGAYFDSHPAIQPATDHIEDTTHPATVGLPAAWIRTDEWYNFRMNPRAAVTVLATLDESSYTVGTMGADHPIAWAHEFEGGRAFYTAMGHTNESYADASFRAHLVGGVRWAARRAP